MSLNFAEVTFEDFIVGEHLTSYVKQSWTVDTEHWTGSMLARWAVRGVV